MAMRVFSVQSVQLFLLKSDPPQLSITAHGMVTTAGWTQPALNPLEEVLSADGVLDLEFVAEPPDGMVAQVVTPISASYVWTDDVERLSAVRVVARTNDVVQLLNPLAGAGGGMGSADMFPPFTTFAVGEEGPITTEMYGEEDPTTRAIGEEDLPTTLRFGEEQFPTTVPLGEEDPTSPAVGEEDPPTTLRFGEEHFPTSPPMGEEDPTTLAIGEEGATTFALGEEGGGTWPLGEGGPVKPVVGEKPPIGEIQNPFDVLGRRNPFGRR